MKNSLQEKGFCNFADLQAWPEVWCRSCSITTLTYHLHQHIYRPIFFISHGSSLTSKGKWKSKADSIKKLTFCDLGAFV